MMDTTKLFASFKEVTDSDEAAATLVLAEALWTLADVFAPVEPIIVVTEEGKRQLEESKRRKAKCKPIQIDDED